MKNDNDNVFSEDFLALGPQSVASSRGYTLNSAGRDALEYVEGLRRLMIPAELDAEPIVVFISEAEAWESPVGREPVNEADRERLSRNVSAALRYLRLPCKIR